MSWKLWNARPFSTTGLVSTTSKASATSIMPFIHNVMNTDYVIGISDTASDALNLLFNTSSGRAYLAKRTGLGQKFLGALADLGLSSIANVLGRSEAR